MAMGIGKYAGKANLIGTVKIFDKSLRKQGTKHNYHPAALLRCHYLLQK